MMKHFYLRAEKYKHTVDPFTLPDGSWTKRAFEKGKEWFLVIRDTDNDWVVKEEMTSHKASKWLNWMNRGDTVLHKLHRQVDRMVMCGKYDKRTLNEVAERIIKLKGE